MGNLLWFQIKRDFRIDDYVGCGSRITARSFIPLGPEGLLSLQGPQEKHTRFWRVWLVAYVS